jgi:hypothetical protein
LISAKTANVLFQAALGRTCRSQTYFINDLRNQRTGRPSSFMLGRRGRPFSPPALCAGCPSDDARGIDAKMKDPEFVAEARQRNLTLAPENGEYMQRLVERIYATPRPVVERVAVLIK